MADFKTHLTFSTTIGVAYGGAAYGLFDLPPQTCILAGGLCAVSGMLPDIDSKSGRPLRESLAFGAAIVPMMLADRLRSMGGVTGIDDHGGCVGLCVRTFWVGGTF